MNSSLSSNISAADLRRAAEIKENIEDLESELNNILALNGASRLNRQTSTPSGTKSKMSAAGLSRIRAAQKARWARFRAHQGKGKGKAHSAGVSHAAPGRRRTMSPAARAKIAAAARARWRKAKAAGRNAL